MKSYLIFKIYLAIKIALATALLYMLAKVFFGRNNFDFLKMNGEDLKLTKYDV
jgi:hypothetical protein